MLLLTPRGAGGIAVLAARPEEEDRLLACLFTAPGRQLAVPDPSAPPRLCSLRLGGEEVDRVLALRNPSTGALEIHAHGSEAVLAALERAFGALGSRLPGGTGGSSRGAADGLLLRAMSEAQLALALEQAAWDFDDYVRELESLPAESRAAAAAEALERSKTALALSTAHRIVLCGRQNAGKSTLMNRLLFRERVLTGDLPGLTRDPVREITCLSDYPYELVDTAGEGPVAEGPDRRALETGRRQRLVADRLLVVDGSIGPTDQDRALCSERTTVLCTKADLPPAHWPTGFPCHGRVSCLDPGRAGEVRGTVGELLRTRRGLPEGGPVGGPAALVDGDLEALQRMRTPPA